MTQSIAKALIWRVCGQERRKLCKRLNELPPFRRGGDNTKLIEMLREEKGRRIVEDMLGIWLGEFGLLVVDEAHKSRGENDEKDTSSDTEQDNASSKATKVLDRLIKNVLKQPETGRRLCLTATLWSWSWSSGFTS